MPGGEREIDVRTLATLDLDGGRLGALEAAADPLDGIFARRQVAGLEAALVLAHHHESQMAVSIDEFHHGAGNRLAGRIIDNALNDAAAVGRLGGRRHDAERDAGGKKSSEVLQCHVLSSWWLLFWS